MPALGRKTQAELSEFKASLIYITSSRPAEASAHHHTQLLLFTTFVFLLCEFGDMCISSRGDRCISQGTCEGQELVMSFHHVCPRD